MADLDHDTQDLDALEDAELAAFFGADDDTKAAKPEPVNSDSSGFDDTAANEGQEPTGDTADSRELPHDDKAEKRVSDAQRRMHEAVNEANTLRGELASAHAQIKALQEEIDRLKSSQTGRDDDDPDLDAILENALDPDVEAIARTLKKTKQQLAERERREAERERQAQEQQARTAQADTVNFITAKHPDAADVIQDQKFLTWLNRQPPAVRNIYHAGSAEDVVWMLDQYKGAANPAQQQAAQRQQQAKAAAVPNVRGQSPAQRQPERRSDGKVPYSSIKHLSETEVMKRYPPEQDLIDWAA